jgi:hypothetical protein
MAVELSQERLDALLAYCEITEPSESDQQLVTLAYAAAVGYMENAGIKEPEAATIRKAQYDLCVNYLVLDSFDRRAVTITGTIVGENPMFRRLINQLKLTDPTMRF